jgi:hypothetical protein
MPYLVNLNDLNFYISVTFFFLKSLIIIGKTEIMIMDKTTFSKFAFTQGTCPKKYPKKVILVTQIIAPVIQ